jgi:hypothetical protein
LTKGGVVGVGGHTWREGRVNPDADHFALAYYEDVEDKWEGRNPPVARVELGDGKTLIVEFLDSEHALDGGIRKAIEERLDFYVCEHEDEDEDEWAYLIYHATSTEANVYSDVAWTYLPRQDESAENNR